MRPPLPLVKSFYTLCIFHIGALTLTDKVKVVLKDRNFRGEIFVTGFHGIGYVGSLAVDYIIKKMQAKRIGFILFNKMPPYVSLEGSRLVLPYELYATKNMVLLRCNVPMTINDMYIVTKCVSEWVSDYNFQEAILIGGLDDKLRTSEGEKLRLAPTRAYIRKFKDKIKGKLLEEGLYIVGPLALLMMFFEIKEFPAITILPYASTERVDPLAASVAIQYLNDVYNLNIDTSELEERGLEIEKAILEKRRKMEEMLKSATRLYV